MKTKDFIPFSNTKVMKNELYSTYKKLTETDYDREEECLTIGHVVPIESPLFAVKFMEVWVEAIEKQLEKMEPYSESYADWFGIRGFTYNEFRLVMETAISEEKIHRIKAYDYMYLDDAIAVEEFKIKYGDEDKSIRQRYLDALGDLLKLEVPFLYRFLCKSKIPFKHPVNNFKRHSYLLAQSSAGKSEFMKILIYQLLLNSHHSKDRTIILLEPHKDLSKDVLRFAMNRGIGMSRVVYLDPDLRGTAKEIVKQDILKKDVHFSINPFDIQMNSRDDLEFMTEHISSAFFDIIESEETFQMKAIIEACVAALILKEGTDITDLKRFMNDSENANLIEFAINNLSGEKRRLFEERFKKDPKIQPTKSSIYYRLQSILGKEFLLNCLKGPATVDINELMNSGKFIICNFNKSRLGPDGAILLGKLTTSLISGYAVLRQKIPKSKRLPTYFLMDEFQNYIHPGTTEQLFAEQRKYATYMICANQQMGQNMSSEMKRIIAGNTAIKFMGENEKDSIEWMSTQMKGLRPDSNFDLPDYAFYMYDKFKKSLGSFILRIPDQLVDIKARYYLDDLGLSKLVLYLANSSGYYRESAKKSSLEKITTKKSVPFSHTFTE